MATEAAKQRATHAKLDKIIETLSNGGALELTVEGQTGPTLADVQSAFAEMSSALDAQMVKLDAVLAKLDALASGAAVGAVESTAKPAAKASK